MSNEYEKVKQEVVNILRNEMGQTAELVYKDRGGKMVQEVRITGEPPVVLSVGVDALIDMGVPPLGIAMAVMNQKNEARKQCDNFVEEFNRALRKN